MSKNNIRKEFIDNLTRSVIKRTLDKGMKDENFKEGATEITDDIVRFLASIVVSTAVTVNMDREKFLLYQSEVGNEVKKTAIKLYDDHTKDKASKSR